jgi:nucleoside-diphosphate-sugar epimerase
MSLPISPRTALVIGATGGFGGHVAQALLKHGWAVRGLARNPAAARARAGGRTAIQWLKGDAMDATSVTAAAAGADLIVHGPNPPGYRNWKGTVLPMLRSTIAAAEASGAQILAPGNVYNFAPDAGADIAEDHPQHPATRKGAIRRQYEDDLRGAAARGVRTILLRAGDFFGPGQIGGGALGWLTVRRNGRVTSLRAPGAADNLHAFAYLPDLGEAAARLADIGGELPAYAPFHFRGHVIPLSEWIVAIREAVGRPELLARPFPYALLTALSPFNETFRELLEMRYLWDRPIALNGDRLAATIGPEPHTPLVTALTAALADLEAAEAERLVA